MRFCSPKYKSVSSTNFSQDNHYFTKAPGICSNPWASSYCFQYCVHGAISVRSDKALLVCVCYKQVYAKLNYCGFHCFRVPIQLTLARLYILTLSIAPRFSLIPDFLLIFTYTTTATVVMYVQFFNVCSRSNSDSNLYRLNARTSYKPSNDVITSFAHVHSFSLPTASSSRHTREPISLCSSTSKVSSCPKVCL